MTEQRFREHFCSDDGGVIVIPVRGEPYRPDGKPLTDADREIIAGRDPLAAELAEFAAEHPEVDEA